jgi:hypothetical protein
MRPDILARVVQPYLVLQLPITEAVDQKWWHRSSANEIRAEYQRRAEELATLCGVYVTWRQAVDVSTVTYFSIK